MKLSTVRAVPSKLQPQTFSRIDSRVKRRRGAPLPAPPPEQRLDAGDELGELERLRHVVVRADLEPPDLVVEAVPGREDQDRHVHLPAAQLREDPEAVDARQHQVEDDEVGAPVEGRPEPLVARRGRQDAVAAEAEVHREPLAERAVVLDDEDRLAAPGALGARAQGASPSRRNGSVTVKTLPFPGSLAARTVPPWRRTRCLTMASPRPVPAAPPRERASTR